MNVSTAQSKEGTSSADVSIIRSAAFDFQQTSYALQTNRIISTQSMGSFLLVTTILCFMKERQGHMFTFMLSHHSLTLKKCSKVKSVTTKRFAANGFLKVDCTLQTFRANNK